MTDHDPTADDWRARIVALTGGDTIEAMLAFTAERGWQSLVGWNPMMGGMLATIFVGPHRVRAAEEYHPTDPAESLAFAILAAVAMGEGRT